MFGVLQLKHSLDFNFGKAELSQLPRAIRNQKFSNDQQWCLQALLAEGSSFVVMDINREALAGVVSESPTEGIEPDPIESLRFE